MRVFSSLVFLLLMWGVVAFGGVYPWAYWPLIVGSAVCGLWAIIVTRAWRDPSARTAMVCAAAVAVALAIQAVPLPTPWMVRLNPSADRLLAAVDLQYVISTPAWHSLSVAQSETLTVLCTFVALALLLIGFSVAAPHLALDRFVVRIMFFATILAVFAIAQRSIDARSPDNDHWQIVYGFWKPRQPGSPFGPFINRNHFAGWIVMALPLVAGYSCAVIEASGRSTRQSWQSWMHWMTTPGASRFMASAIAVLAMGASLVASGSRSGMASFAVSMAVIAYFVAGRIGTGRARAFAVACFLVVLVGAAAWAGTSRVVDRFALASADIGTRTEAWRDTGRIIADFPLFGTGAGGYPLAMLTYQTGVRERSFKQSHNDYLQVLSDGGLLVTIPFVIGVIALVRGIRKRLSRGDPDPMTRWVRIGAIAGLVGMAAQSLVEFSLQIPANTVFFAVLVGIALHRPLRPSHASRV